MNHARRNRIGIRVAGRRDGIAGGVTSSYSNDEMEEVNAAGMATTDALLLGRVTYEGLAAYWPNQPGGDPMVDHINSVQKFVVSTTLDEVGWNNSTLITENVAEELTELKRQPGKDITVLGSAQLVRSLLRDGLLDELRLMVHLVVIGGEKCLFGDASERNALELVESETFDTGVVSLTYQPAGERDETQAHQGAVEDPEQSTG